MKLTCLLNIATITYDPGSWVGCDEFIEELISPHHLWQNEDLSGVSPTSAPTAPMCGSVQPGLTTCRAFSKKTMICSSICAV